MNIDERIFCTPRELLQLCHVEQRRAFPTQTCLKYGLLSRESENPLFWGCLLHSSVPKEMAKVKVKCEKGPLSHHESEQGTQKMELCPHSLSASW